MLLAVPGNESGGSHLFLIQENAWNVPKVRPCPPGFPQGILTL